MNGISWTQRKVNEEVLGIGDRTGLLKATRVAEEAYLGI